MMLKLGRNMRWVEILSNFKNLMTSSLIPKYDVIIVIFDVATIQEVESRHCFFVFGWIKLKFGVRGNFMLLISNLNSKTQYLFAI